MNPLPQFPYHRDPIASGSIKETGAVCECCGKARGAMFKGVVYAADAPDVLCPWCIADGLAAEKYDASFFDAYFCDDAMNEVKMPVEVHRQVFSETIGFATFNPIGWWVHCGEPAEYVFRDEPYDMIFQCRKCQKEQIIQDLD